MRLKLLAGLLPLLLAAPVAIAAENPSADEVNRVFSYIYEGQYPLLLEAKACSQVVRGADNAAQCAGELDTNRIVQGSRPLLWMSFLVPKQADAEVRMSFRYESRPYPHTLLKTAKGMRYRVTRYLETAHVGRWQVELSQLTDHGFEPIATIPYTVVAH
ncbi:hypothetical protein [Oceanobacter mangrovi]|uniref:hypothetical protein n=1 Tax=Oceanobacter mangrovi TaxID=2862510 RepID=UPI001C8D048D|nr:hypothetical protein [Oceanobacter mangrovi]